MEITFETRFVICNTGINNPMLSLKGVVSFARSTEVGGAPPTFKGKALGTRLGGGGGSSYNMAAMKKPENTSPSPAKGG